MGRRGGPAFGMDGFRVREAPLATPEFRIGHFDLGGLTEKSRVKFVTNKFPQAGRVRPKRQNLLMTDFSLERPMKDQLTLGHRYGYFQMRAGG